MENKFMRIAIEEAKEAAQNGEVPVGAVIVRNGEIIAKCHNETIVRNNPCNHAERLAIDEAFEKTGAYRLTDCDLYVTLEPCAMCAGAIELSRIRRVYFGAYDAEKGAYGGKTDISKELNFRAEIYGGICENECSEILKKFFLRREKPAGSRL